MNAVTGADLFGPPASFGVGHRTALSRLALKAGDRVLVVGLQDGVGGGADLSDLPSTCSGVATDVSRDLLEHAAASRPAHFELRRMDPHALELPSASFDAVLAHHLLAAARDPARCLAEAARVMRPGGRLSVFDRFLPRGFQPPLWHRVARGPVDVVFRLAVRSFEEILASSRAPLSVLSDEPAAPLSPFRILVLRKAG
jgi:phosphatidylethanolamine/phosphatidyl-N-methylethanolamine N-methyltransferase